MMDEWMSSNPETIDIKRFESSNNSPVYLSTHNSNSSVFLFHHLIQVMKYFCTFVAIGRSWFHFHVPTATDALLKRVGRLKWNWAWKRKLWSLSIPYHGLANETYRARAARSSRFGQQQWDWLKSHYFQEFFSFSFSCKFQIFLYSSLIISSRLIFIVQDKQAS